MPNNDYIKRSEAVARLTGKSLCVNSPGKVRAFATAINVIETMPAADVEPKMEWISVTERLPKTNEKVLVYVFDPDFCGPYIEFGHWLNWLKRWGEFDDEVGDFGDYTIIAWMPLPEPPKGEDDAEVH